VPIAVSTLPQPARRIAIRRLAAKKLSASVR
jgi:hypothetical protein